MTAHQLDFQGAPSDWGSQLAQEKKEDFYIIPVGSSFTVDNGATELKPRLERAANGNSSLPNPRRRVAAIVGGSALVLLIGLLAGLVPRRTSDTHATTLGSSSSSNAASTPTFSTSPSLSTPTSLKTAQNRATCFPLGNATLPATGPPSVARVDWWCAPALLYGFLGFSYPLENSDCNDPSNGFEQMTNDFSIMRQTGARFVRVYAPSCRQLSLWENLVQAGVENGMGVVAMVWWGFDSNAESEWRKGEESLYRLFSDSEYASVAPYVVHSASFGSEPIGDGVDGGVYGGFIADLGIFRKKMNGFGIPVGISEDWDRTGNGQSMNSTGAKGLGDVGKQVKVNTDMVHAHVMPYFHPSDVPLVGGSIAYVERYLQWLQAYVQQPIFITETMWSSSNDGGHTRGSHDDQIGMAEFASYWEEFASECAMFKQYTAGWFFHTFSDNDEPGYGLFTTSGVSKISGYSPRGC